MNSIGKNYVINLLFPVIPLLIAVATIPLYVKWIGPTRLGILSLVWLAIGYSGFLDVGLSRATANSLAKIDEEDRDSRRHILSSAVFTNLGIGLVGATSGAILWFGSLWFFRDRITSDWLELIDASPAIFLAMPILLLSGVLAGALEARGRFFPVNLVSSVGGVAAQILPIGVAILVSPSLALLVPIVILVRSATALALFLIVVAHEGRIRFADFQSTTAKRLLTYGGWVTISSLVSPLLASSDQFVIASFLGPIGVAYYSVSMTLAIRAQLVPTALSRTIFPRLSTLPPDQSRALAEKAIIAVAYGFPVVICPAILAAPVLFSLWLGSDFAANAVPIAAVLFAGAWANSIGYVSYSYLHGQGKPDIPAKLHLLELVPFLMGLWVCVSVFGLMGAAFAYVIRCLVDTALLTLQAKISSRSLVKALGGGLLVVLSEILSRQLDGGLLTRGAAATAVGLLALLAFCAAAPDVRRSVMSLARSMLVSRH